MQQAHILYSWATHTNWNSCAIRINEFRAIRTHPFIHGQYAPCCVHVQYAPVLISHNTHQFEFMCSAYWSLCTCNIDQVSIHGQYESYAYLEQYAPTFIGYKHLVHILGIHPILGQCVLFGTLTATRLT